MQQQVQFIAYAPDQLLSFIAVQVLGSGPASMTVTEAVTKAVEIVAEASIQQGNGALLAAVQSRDPNFVADQNAKMAAAQKGIMVPGGPLPPELLKRNLQRQ